MVFIWYSYGIHMVFIWYSYGIRGISWENHTFFRSNLRQSWPGSYSSKGSIETSFPTKRQTNATKNYPQSIKLLISISISFYILIHIYIYISLSLYIHRSIYQSKYILSYHKIYIYILDAHEYQGLLYPSPWVPGSLGPWVVPRWKAPDHQSPPSLVPTILIFEAPEGLERGGFTVNEVDIYIYINMYVCLYLLYTYIQILRYNICGCIYDMGLSTKFRLACKMIHDEVGKLGS